MKKIILLIATLFSLVACNKIGIQTENNSIVGKWKLSEYLADPGDGSGAWQRATSSNSGYLEFKEDGRLIFSPSSVYAWDHYQLTSDSTIILFRGTDQFIRGYHFSKTLLTLSGGCIEGCSERYIPAN